MWDTPEFFTDAQLDAFCTGFVHAVESFGGCPRVVLVDNLKSVVLERVGDLVHFHPRALELFGHYMTWGQPCAPARGAEKGRVERTIRYLRTSFWPARRFANLADLNRQATAWVASVAHHAAQLRGQDRLAAVVPRTRQLLDHLARRGDNLGAATQRLLRLLDDYGADEMGAVLDDVLESGPPSVGSIAYLLDRRRRA